jgi:hypothetical protein
MMPQNPWTKFRPVNPAPDSVASILGLPKSATTMLQTDFFPKHRQIRYLGKNPNGLPLYSEKEIGSVLDPIANLSLKKDEVEQYRDRMAPVIAQAYKSRCIPT